MKTFFLVAVTIFLFAACEKKSKVEQHSYTCIRNDSVVSNIPILVNAHYKTLSVFYGQNSDAQINFLIKKYTYTDTLYFKNDTLEQEYWTMTCALFE